MESKEELSLEDLISLQNNVKCKTRNKTVYQKEKKRVNKNRPREQSSKIPVKTFHTKKNKRTAIRDPRFDNLCGTFNEKFFQDNYGFLNEIKANEKQQLKESLKKEVDPCKKERISFLLKRMKDQERENNRRYLKEKKKEEETEKIKKNLLQGKRAHFKTKSEKKLTELVEKYEELKSKGKVQSFIKKKLKKTKKLQGYTPF